MRMKLYPWVLGLCAFGPGCGPLVNVTRTMVIEPLQYNDPADKVVELARDSKLAKEAWAEVCAANPRHAFSVHYEDGFKDGYVDYLYAGGNGHPPAMPPRRYWKAKFQTPAGYQMIEEWFAGFAHGSAVAMASGYRAYIPVPSSAPAETSPDDRPAGKRPVPPPPAPADAPEVLPPPKVDAPPPGEPQVSTQPAGAGLPVLPSR